jgi:hypothetical protein
MPYSAQLQGTQYKAGASGLRALGIIARSIFAEALEKPKTRSTVAVMARILSFMWIPILLFG